MKPERVAADERAGDIRRFSIADLPEWGLWLIGRLSDRYPGFNQQFWLGKIHNALNSGNEFLFVRNERAVLLLSTTPRFLDARLIITEIFMFSRDAIKSPKTDRYCVPHEAPEERSMILLYRHAREWARAQKAARLYFGQCTDFDQIYHLKDIMRPANTLGWVVVNL
jgi:hypothetical protein